MMTFSVMSGCSRFRFSAVAVPAAGEPAAARLILAVGGDQQPGRDVKGHADAGEQGQRGDDDADQRDVRAQAPGDARATPPSIRSSADRRSWWVSGWSVAVADRAPAVVVLMVQGCRRRWPPSIGITPVRTLMRPLGHQGHP